MCQPGTRAFAILAKWLARWARSIGKVRTSSVEDAAEPYGHRYTFKERKGHASFVYIAGEVSRRRGTVLHVILDDDVISVVPLHIASFAVL